MADIGIMIEGQDGLNWSRWQRILQTAEDGGYQCLFRSDHYANANPPEKDSLELWVSLTYAATHTKRIEFGPMVAPVTFRQPTITARMAAAVDDLSGGRLVLGLGAGWNDREHRMFGLPFPPLGVRHEMLIDALEITQRLFNSDEAVSYAGKHFSLDEAILLPRPQRPGGPPISIGGRGKKYTLPAVVKYATEWNTNFVSIETFKETNSYLDELLNAAGRQPEEVKRSLMTQAIFEGDEAALKTRLGSRSASELIERGLIVGTAPMHLDQMGAWAEAGIERFCLQWLNQDDIRGLELIARDVLPHFHNQ